MPTAGQRRQQVDLAVLALQQHLCDAGCHAKIAVDLEGWVCVEEVGVDAASLHDHVRVLAEFQHVPDHSERVIAVLQASPEVDLPSHGPAGAAVAAEFQRTLSRIPQSGRAAPGDLVAGMQRQQMRGMTVLILRVIPVERPFLQLAQPSDLERVELDRRFGKLCSIFSINAQNLSSGDALAEEVTDQRHVHG